ncbi:MAG: hypothetical protein ACSHYA_13480 [Opitutaceae bacterium]
MNLIASLFSLWWFRLILFVSLGILVIDIFWFTQVPSAQFLSEEEGKLLTTEGELMTFLGAMAGFILFWRIKGNFTMINGFSSHSED